MYQDPFDAPPDTCRVRFAMDARGAGLLIAEHHLSTRRPASRLVRIWRTAGRSAGSAIVTVTPARCPATGEVEIRLRARPPREWSTARGLPGRADPFRYVRLVVECHETRRVLGLELTARGSEDAADDGDGAPPLAEGQRLLLDRLRRSSPDRVSATGWHRGVALVEDSWSTTVNALPVTVRRWTRLAGPDTGHAVATELHAAAQPDEGQVMVAILAAHLRLIGVDPAAGPPWVEELLGHEGTPSGRPHTAG